MTPCKQLLLVALVFVFATSAFAQTSTPPNVPAANQAAVTTQPAASAADIQALKDGLAAAQRQIQSLQEELHRRDQAVEHAQITAADAAAKADAAQQQAAQQQQTVGDLQNAVADLKSVSATSVGQATLKNAVFNVDDSGQAATPQPGQQQVFNQQMESPITIRFRGINITPGGYSEGAFVRRSHALGADLPTPFNSIPEPGASQNQLSEFFGSGRQSKITTFVEGRVGNVDLSSYVSADFLSAGVTSTSTQTNGYTLRIRQAWGQAKFNNGFSFLAGQAWSLATEDAKGIAPDDDMGKTNDVRPKTIDPSYNVGFDFARQYGIRLTKSFGNKVAFAVALENPQATVTTHGNANLTVGATTVTTPTGTTTVGGTAYYNFLVGQAGASNSYNTAGTYGFNPSPDIIAKVAFDPGFGHYEIYGIATRFTDRAFPCVEGFVASVTSACNPTGGLTATASELAVGAFNASKEGGGIGASARWNLFSKHITFGLKGFGGSGVGRYAPGGLPDASVNPDGTIHLVKNLHGLGTLEWHSKKLDVYSYGGVEYAARSYGYDSFLNANVGYGAPTFNNTGCYTELPPTASNGFTAGGTGKCTGDTRALIEGTLGFWYKFYSGERGRFQFGTQYSYVARNVWSGNNSGKSAGLQPGGIDSMVFTSFRYYLP